MLWLSSVLSNKSSLLYLSALSVVVKDDTMLKKPQATAKVHALGLGLGFLYCRRLNSITYEMETDSRFMFWFFETMYRLESAV